MHGRSLFLLILIITGACTCSAEWHLAYNKNYCYNLIMEILQYMGYSLLIFGEAFLYTFISLMHSQCALDFLVTLPTSLLTSPQHHVWCSQTDCMTNNAWDTLVQVYWWSCLKWRHIKCSRLKLLQLWLAIMMVFSSNDSLADFKFMDMHYIELYYTIVCSHTWIS